MSLFKHIFILLILVSSSSNAHTSEKRINSDSLKSKSDSIIQTHESEKLLDEEFDLMQQAYRTNNKDFYFYSNKTIQLCSKLQDYQKLSSTYSYRGRYLLNKYQYDSAYFYFYKALKLVPNDKLKSGKLLLKMAITQKNARDYLGSLKTTLRALDSFKEKNDYRYMASCYNNLGILSHRLQDFHRSIEYHQKAKFYREKIKNPLLSTGTLNNLGVVYQNMKEYDKALKYFNDGLKTPSLSKKSSIYATLQDNKSYTLFLQREDMNSAVNGLKEAYQIRKKLNNLDELSTSALHLAEYYSFIGQKEKGFNYLEEAENTAKKIGNILGLLETYRFYLEFNFGNEKQASAYFSLQDSILKTEKMSSQQFALIRYEVDEKEKENQELRIKNEQQEIKTERQKRYFYYTLGTLVIALLTGLLYSNSQQLKVKNKELIIQQKEREAEKEIERLLHQQQSYAEKSKQKEQERISNDLHDSIAGKLSGIMLHVDNLSQKVQPNLQSKVNSLADYLSDIIQETHAIVQDLNQDRIIQTSFQTILEQLVKNQLSSTSDRVTEIQKVNWDMIPSNIKVAIYYIIQQALRNIQEHAEASNIWIKMIQNTQKLQIEIKDNGKGFDTSRAFNIGIPSMKKRAEAVGGICTIQSEINQGTTIDLKFPLS